MTTGLMSGMTTGRYAWKKTEVSSRTLHLGVLGVMKQCEMDDYSFAVWVIGMANARVDDDDV